MDENKVLNLDEVFGEERPVKVKWNVAFNPADLPGWKTFGIPFRKTSMEFGRRLLPTCLIFLWGNRLATWSSASEFLVT